MSWALIGCGQSPKGQEWSSGTLVFNGSRIESGRDSAYYRAADVKFPAEENDAELYVINPGDWQQSHIFIHPFMGRLKTELLRPNSYLLTGKINLPNDGNWKEDFIKHIAFEATLDFNEDGWLLHEFNADLLSLPVNGQRLDSIRNILETEAVAKSEDWDSALAYFDLIKQYEYDLFTAVLSGDSVALNEYLLLQENYNIAYAGEFSEYFAGNIFFLLSRGVIGPTDLREAGVYNDFPYLKRVYGSW
jgi:hypothetical protein